MKRYEPRAGPPSRMDRGERRTPGRGGRRHRLGSDRAWLAPGLSVLGLAVVALFTAALFGGQLPSIIPVPGGVLPQPRPTPHPVIVVPARRTDVLGTILFVKAGNVWAASGTEVRQSSTTATDSDPAWSADGQSIYLIETRTKRNVSFLYEGRVSRYALHYPVIVRMAADGTGRTDVADSLYTTGPGGRYTYHVWYFQPTPDPLGGRIAVVSDGPSPIGRDPVIQLMRAKGGKLTNLGLPFEPRLGLADPAWRPDGGAIAYTRYGRKGFEPAHRIAVYTVETEKVKSLTKPGYSQPAWSPDGRFITAVRWNGTRRDVVILDASKGTEVLAVTSDGRSWAPVWSPAGDAIAFLTASGEDIDLDLALIKQVGTNFTLGERLPVTERSLLDGTSRPSWFVPPELLPAPTPVPSPTPSPAGSATPSSSPMP